MNNLSIRKMTEVSKKKKKGFTLVELIIVIAIIAILAAIAIPKFGAVRQNANVKSDIANAKNIQSMVASAIANNEIDLAATEKTYSLDSIGETTKHINITSKIDGNTIPKASGPSTVFKVKIAADGNVAVMIGDTTVQVYPNSTGIYAS